jgi:hypothetical protein
MKTLSLDTHKENGLHDLLGEKHEAGGPQPLKSSWMMNERPPAPPRPTKTTFFLDNREGITVAQARTLTDAYTCQREHRRRGIRLFIRPFVLDEEQRQTEEANIRWKRQQGML